MELDTVDRPRLVLHTHDFAVRRPGGDLEFSRQGLTLDGQRMITRRCKRVRQAFENTCIVVMYLTGLPMHQGLGADNVAAIGLPNRLVTQADAKHGHVIGCGTQQRQANTRLIRCTRPR